MILEHVALNVPDARALARWYVAHLGLKVVREQPVAPYMHFLADASGRTVLEVYTNLSAPVPDYPNLPPLCLHIAYATADARSERTRLCAAGATPFSEEVLPDGSVILMLRDPWGLPLQLCQRAVPLP